jgi:hypothetical protein
LTALDGARLTHRSLRLPLTQSYGSIVIVIIIVVDLDQQQRHGLRALMPRV